MFILPYIDVYKPVEKECTQKHKNIWKRIPCNAILCMQSEEREILQQDQLEFESKSIGLVSV